MKTKISAAERLGYFGRLSLYALIFCLLFSICSGAELYASGIGPEPSSIVNVTQPETPTASVTPIRVPENHVFTKTLNEKSGDTKILGERPFFAGLPDSEAQEQLNEKILKAYNRIVNNLPESVRTASFSYELKYDDSYICLIMLCTKYTGIFERVVNTFNLNRVTCLPAEINDVLGPNGVKIINKLISVDSKRNPSKYNNSISSIADDHNFYVVDDVLHVIFDDYEISPRRENLFEFDIKLGAFKNCYIEKDDYYSATVYNIKMLMAKQVADTFSYELRWTPAQKRIDFYRDDKLAASVTINLNSYSVASSQSNAPKRKLEAAPALKGGRTYLPISFYDEILGLTYSAGSDGRVCVSEYRDVPAISNEN